MNNDPQLRYKITSDEWVVIAPKRSGKFKASDLKKKKKKRVVSSLATCPFERPQESGNGAPHFWYPQHKPIEQWELQVFENKYPALTHTKRVCAVKKTKGLYTTIDGVGYHDVLVTRDHTKNFCHLSKERVLHVFEAFVQRYREIASDSCVRYVSIFQNWGEDAGASVYHPHYQIIGMPVVPSDVATSLSVSKSYFKKHKRCVHCDIIKNERSQKDRIVYENKDAIAFVPFAAKEPFQVNIFPKKHSAYFEDVNRRVLGSVAGALGAVLSLVEKNTHDSDYNFFLHTAPTRDKKAFSHYHWHFEVVPKSNISAGFELGTGVEINPVLPEDAARILRNKK